MDSGVELRPRQRRVTPALHPFPLPEPLQKNLERGLAERAQPFRGITTDGQIVPGLYKLQKTGLSLQPVVDAALAFLATLGAAEKVTATFSLDSDAWRSWQNMHPFMVRHGLCLEYLTPEQRAAAMGLLEASLSAAGFTTARDVMKLNHHIGEITQRWNEYGEWFYWVSLMGVPSASEPWGWQIDGHHLNLNCFLLGDQLVLTPGFMGSEPVRAHSGKYAGAHVFEAEESQGFQLMSALSPEQRKQATIGEQLPFDVFAAAFRDNLVMCCQGLRHDEMSKEQQLLLRDLIRTYVGRIRPGHAEIRLEEVMRHIAETRFAWIGSCDAESPFYYRIQSPVILIEFDHQPGVALDNDQPSRRHIHTLVRSPNGNDYGKDLLRQHYQQFDHGDPRSAHRQGRE